ncbi:hypothetical protein AVEN_274807-1 [Araneus ventricosus]|uniref:Uncharacterized protein n=1 Tax=Araneus ventricosus TaxID=182803 RepID=A0A4Y2TB76_ARAVE|nr:hypothetical protein AVEN_274807-1 [Araneus ventricosus]
MLGVVWPKITLAPGNPTQAINKFNTEKNQSQYHGAYSTTPIAALQVIEGIIPLHIKAQIESILVRGGRLRRDCNWDGSCFFHQDFEQRNPPIIIHPAHLDDGVSIVSDPHPQGEVIYTDVSHFEGETG